MSPSNIIVLHLCLFATHLADDESDSCFRNGLSPECTSLIQSRHNITLEEIAGVRSHIKSLVDSHKLRITAQGITAFDMSMGCYAIGQRLPSERGCVSCLNCKQQMSAEVCDLFCHQGSVAHSTIARPQVIEHTRDGKLYFRDKSSMSEANIMSDPFKVILLTVVIILLILLCIIVSVLIGFIYLHCKKNRKSSMLLFFI